MNERPCTSYDQVPYPSHPYVQSHPNNLSTIARLFGMQPARVDRCRVLEIGCASGGNLIPMADCFPESEFIGIDLSRVQLAEGEQLIKKAELSNIKLHHLSIADLNKDFGTFDYIICHGVYSWVSSALQQRILAACSELLGRQGVAYVSYNTYPGWHLRGICRAMMAFHSSRYVEPSTRIAQARAMLDFMAESISDRESAYAALLNSELDLLRGQSDSYLYHDHLEDVNEPIYFHQFIERAQGSNLQYLGEANMGSMSTDDFPPHVQKTLNLLATDIVQMEQYIDFLRNRAFRQTLLCHENVDIRRRLDWSLLHGLYVASGVSPQSAAPNLEAGKKESFADPKGRIATSDDPSMKAVLLTLAEKWPLPVQFEQLTQMATDCLQAAGITAPVSAKVFGDLLLEGYAAGGAKLQTAPPTFVTSISNSPVASAVARAQAQTSPAVTNGNHMPVQLEPLDSVVLRYLNGQRDIDELAKQLRNAFETGELTPRPKEDETSALGQCRNLVEMSLQRLSQLALLIA